MRLCERQKSPNQKNNFWGKRAGGATSRDRGKDRHNRFCWVSASCRILLQGLGGRSFVRNRRSTPAKAPSTKLRPEPFLFYLLAGTVAAVHRDRYPVNQR